MLFLLLLYNLSVIEPQPFRRQLNIDFRRALRTADLPLNLVNAHFLVGLLVILKPFALLQIDGCKLGTSLSTLGKPLALASCQHISKPGRLVTRDVPLP
jgi:hypothetical protein